MRNPNLWAALLLIVSMIMGMFGGACVAAAKVIHPHNKAPKLVVGLSYMMVGAGFGVAGLIMIWFIEDLSVTLQNAVALGFGLGVIGTALMAAGNFSMQWVARRLGLRIIIETEEEYRGRRQRKRSDGTGE